MKKIKGTLWIACIWVVIYGAGLQYPLSEFLCGKGIQTLHSEYYRLLTGWLVHKNWLHLLANVSALYFAGVYLEETIGTKRFLLYGLCCITVTQVLLSFIFSGAASIIGGSILIFSLIGGIVSICVLPVRLPKLRLHTWCGRWLLAYAILGNLPLFSLIDGSTIITHALALAVGAAAGCAGIGVCLKRKPKSMF